MTIVCTVSLTRSVTGGGWRWSVGLNGRMVAVGNEWTRAAAWERARGLSERLYADMEPKGSER